MKKAAIKFCGGCDPVYDRVKYWHLIKAASAGLIDWVSPEHEGIDIMLIINGCEKACPRDELEPMAELKIISLTDNAMSPELVVKKIIKREGDHD